MNTDKTLIHAGCSYSANKFPFNLLSLLIRWVQGTDFSHVWLSYTSETGNVMVLDATNNRVRLWRWKEWKTHNIVVRRYVSREPVHREVITLFWEMHLNKSYGRLQLRSLFLMFLINKLGFNIKRNLFHSKETRIICNELFAMFARDVLNFPVKSDLDSVDLVWIQRVFANMVSANILMEY